MELVLKGAEFTVKDSEGRNIGRYVTGTDGTVTVSGLTPNGTYVVSESKAPTGYIKDETPKNIVVRSGVANSLTFDDEPATTLIIRKFIEGTENEPLSGVAFKVVDGNGGARVPARLFQKVNCCASPALMRMSCGVPSKT